MFSTCVSGAVTVVADLVHPVNLHATVGYDEFELNPCILSG